MTISGSRRRAAYANAALFPVAGLLLALASTPGVAAEGADAPRPRKKVQEVDLHRIEIQGRLDNPTSVFLLEKGATALPDLWTLDGLFPAHWLSHIDKDAFDRRARSPEASAPNAIAADARAPDASTQDATAAAAAADAK